MKKEEYKFEIPKEVRKVSLVLSHAGFENYLVGGCVRDLMRKVIHGESVEPKDWDITTAATPEEIATLFPRTFYENDFGTVGVVNENTDDETLRVVEVTPFRLESAYSDKRHPDKVEWAKSVKEDLARRDFTINAIALKISDESGISVHELVDPFEGESDIRKKIIRTVGRPEERFDEDALRLLRALRLASELGFAIEHETQVAIEEKAELLEQISRERVRDEFTKIIMSDTPAFALELASRLGILKFISPELEKGIGVEQGRAHAYNVWEHLLRSLNHAASKKFPLHVRLAALFHDIAKPHTRKRQGEIWTFYGHEVVGARLTRAILNDLRYPGEVVDKVVKLVRWHMFFSDTEEITHAAVRRIVRNVGPELIWDLMNVRAADRIGTGRPKETPYRLRKYKAMIEQVMRDPISVKQLALDGSEIMKLTGSNPGPEIGFILEILLSEVLDNPELNTKMSLEARVRELHTLPKSELAKLGAEAIQKNALEEDKETEKILVKHKVR